MPQTHAPSEPGSPPSPDGGWSSQIVQLHHAVVAPPDMSGMVQPCGVLAAGGSFCEHSATWRGSRAMMTRPTPQVAPAKLAGRHLFAGQLWFHFGHFMAESMSRLWALDHLDSPPDSIIFIPKRPGKSTALKRYQRDFFELLGVKIPIQVLEHPTEVENLIVPGQGFGLGQISQGTEKFRRYFANNFARSIPAEGPENIYLSRAKLGGMEGSVVLEDILERNLMMDDYVSYHPQQHSIRDQVAQYRGAKNVIGLDGSAFHLFGFVGKPTQKAAVILRRNSNVFQGLHMQISSFCGISPTLVDTVVADWIPSHKQRPGRYSHGQLDFSLLSDTLQRAGFIKNANKWDIPNFRAVKQAMMKHSQEKGVAFERVKKSPPKGTPT